ncbi:GNAT family N-acetyltransferase [Streptomyces pharetrae]|uniref:GNAT family N-acetyltransferase n=1 Tax=Streptomyces pharetrae TaxID=291370 RepID=UPI00364CB97C
MPGALRSVHGGRPVPGRGPGRPGALPAVAQRRRLHAARFARQEAGRSSCLVPWPDGSPVGHAELRWTGCAAPEARAAHPGCPEPKGLAVRPEPLRSRGIGTALIRTAERLARERGIDVMGLGAGPDNPRAAALYAARTPAFGGLCRPLDIPGRPGRPAGAGGLLHVLVKRLQRASERNTRKPSRNEPPRHREERNDLAGMRKVAALQAQCPAHRVSRCTWRGGDPARWVPAVAGVPPVPARPERQR